jgi:hypothetical protein
VARLHTLAQLTHLDLGSADGVSALLPQLQSLQLLALRLTYYEHPASAATSLPNQCPDRRSALVRSSARLRFTALRSSALNSRAQPHMPDAQGAVPAAVRSHWLWHSVTGINSGHNPKRAKQPTLIGHMQLCHARW